LCRGEGAVACEEEEQRKREGRARDERDQGGSPVRSHPLAGSAVPRMEMYAGFYAQKFEFVQIIDVNVRKPLLDVESVDRNRPRSTTSPSSLSVQ
jgi:hypothetical protein